MRNVSIRQLHEKTGDWVRQEADLGEVTITDRGRPVAKIVPVGVEPEVPYFARRKLSPAFKGLVAIGRLRGGTDSTRAISEDREGGIS